MSHACFRAPHITPLHVLALLTRCKRLLYLLVLPNLAAPDLQPPQGLQRFGQLIVLLLHGLKLSSDLHTSHGHDDEALSFCAQWSPPWQILSFDNVLMPLPQFEVCPLALAPAEANHFIPVPSPKPTPGATLTPSPQWLLSMLCS